MVIKAQKQLIIKVCFTSLDEVFLRIQSNPNSITSPSFNLIHVILRAVN